ncbi:MAG: glycerophosphodiester phosphodiesterase [Oscillospiraceae bacterium]|nr:glycerophosphodiester phosphodiesterase [Oscillospiraceae bacterium]
MSRIVAHRGFSGLWPENSMLAFEKAALTGCWGIELDVQLTKDGVPVIFHDETLERCSTGSGFLKDHTLAQLKALELRPLPAEGPAQKMPTLREYLEWVKNTPLVTNIELKTGVFEYPGIEETVVAMVKELGLEERVWYSSFNHYTVLRLKEKAGKSLLGLLLGDWLVGIGDYAAGLGADSVNAPTEYLSRAIVQELHSKNILAAAYTPNSTEELTRLMENGVDVLITNWPDKAMALAAKRKAGGAERAF